MPETLSGYGYDEVYTVCRCWRRGGAIALLTGWNVHHFGSVTFGPEAGNITPALRRNLSRLLTVMEASDLDTREHPDRIIQHLYAREVAAAPQVLALGSLPDNPRWRERQGYQNALHPRAAPGSAHVLGTSTSWERCQWLPWLANELCLQPTAAAVGGQGWYAIRHYEEFQRQPQAERDRVLAEARSVGPAPPPLMPRLPVKRPTLRQRISAIVHTWKQRSRRLPEGW
jgi:hypothetical protein